jgi:hypothetical protein
MSNLQAGALYCARIAPRSWLQRLGSQVTCACRSAMRRWSSAMGRASLRPPGSASSASRTCTLMTPQLTNTKRTSSQHNAKLLETRHARQGLAPEDAAVSVAYGRLHQPSSRRHTLPKG